MLVHGLLSLGLPVAPDPWKWHEELRETIDGQIRRTLVFRFLANGRSADGVPLVEVVRRWNDPAWLAAHPADSITQVANTLRNAAKVATLIRSGSAAVDVIKRGRNTVRIPINATPDQRADWLQQLAAA